MSLRARVFGRPGGTEGVRRSIDRG